MSIYFFNGYIENNIELRKIENENINLLDPFCLNSYNAFTSNEYKKEHKKDLNKKYYEEYKEYYKELKKEWQQNNKDKVCNQQKRHYEKYKDEINEKNKNNNKKKIMCAICNKEITYV